MRTLAALSNATLRWCCDVVPAALDKVRDHCPRVQTTSQLDDLLADPVLDAVVIATGAPTHFAVARQALLAGKHVLVEKPMTLTTAHAQALTELAARQRRVLMVGHLLEYHPVVRRLRRMIDDGALGEVSYLVCERLNLGVIRADENAWWSLAPHDVSVANRLFGAAPLSVQCRGQCIVRPGIEDVVFATLEYPGGRLAHVHVSWLDPHKRRTLTVVGTRRMAVFDDTAAQKLVVYDKGILRRRRGDAPPRGHRRAARGRGRAAGVRGTAFHRMYPARTPADLRRGIGDARRRGAGAWPAVAGLWRPGGRHPAGRGPAAGGVILLAFTPAHTTNGIMPMTV